MTPASAELRALAEAAYASLNAGDFDSFVGFIHEDVEFTSLVAEPEGVTFRGHAGVRTWWDTIRGSIQDGRWDLLETRASGATGIACVHISGTIAGVPVEQRMWQVIRMRDGKAWRWDFFRGEAEALDAAVRSS